MPDDFCVFILSHGRADRLYTLKTLKASGYTGRWYVVIDNEDVQEHDYRKRYGEHVIQFDKLAESKTFDTMDTSDDRRCIVYARNACFRLAKEVGCRYFLELDDDYTSFEYRYSENGKLKVKKVKDLDRLFVAYLDFLNDTGAATVAMAQGGDLIGGSKSKNYSRRVLRKAMNTFFCDVERPFKFIGRVNEDVNTYVLRGSQGLLMLTAVDASIVQKQTQSNSGGMADMYLDSGTYIKSFYTVMVAPSCVKVAMMGDKHMRIHHHVDWNHAVPKIVNERWRKNG